MSNNQFNNERIVRTAEELPIISYPKCDITKNLYTNIASIYTRSVTDGPAYVKFIIKKDMSHSEENSILSVRLPIIPPIASPDITLKSSSAKRMNFIENDYIPTEEINNSINENIHLATRFTVSYLAYCTLLKYVEAISKKDYDTAEFLGSLDMFKDEDLKIDPDIFYKIYTSKIITKKGKNSIVDLDSSYNTEEAKEITLFDLMNCNSLINFAKEGARYLTAMASDLDAYQKYNKSTASIKTASQPGDE